MIKLTTKQIEALNYVWEHEIVTEYILKELFNISTINSLIDRYLIVEVNYCDDKFYELTDGSYEYIRYITPTPEEILIAPDEKVYEIVDGENNVTIKITGTGYIKGMILGIILDRIKNFEGESHLYVDGIEINLNDNK